MNKHSDMKIEVQVTLMSAALLDNMALGQRRANKVVYMSPTASPPADCAQSATASVRSLWATTRVPEPKPTR